MKISLITLFICLLITSCGGGETSSSTTTTDNNTSIQFASIQTNDEDETRASEEPVNETEQDSNNAQTDATTIIPTLNGQPIDCSSTVDKNNYVYAVMKDIYLWREEIPEVNPSQFDSTQSLLDAITYKELDQWTSVSSTEDFYTYFEEGKNLGYGFRLSSGNEDPNTIWFSYVWPDSPAGHAGIQRGFQLQRVNNIPVDEITNWNDIFGANEEGVITQLTFVDHEQRESSINLSKAWYDISTVNHSNIFTLDDHKVGYFSFSNFISTSEGELNALFQYFKEQSVNNLIIDMRYNGGGTLNIATQLASLANPNHHNAIFTQLLFNNQYQSSNINYLFSELTNSINFNNIYVLATHHTASASEAFINGLKPYRAVTIVGADTYGKPVGSTPIEYCNEVISPITFNLRNNNNEGDYFSGLSADCAAEDNPQFNLGNPTEPMLATALEHLNTGQCEPTSTASNNTPNAKSQVIYDSKPRLISNF